MTLVSVLSSGGQADCDPNGEVAQSKLSNIVAQRLGGN